MRERGYYWIREKPTDIDMQIAFYIKDGWWFIFGIDGIFSDEDFEEIDERRIVRQEDESHSLFY